MKKAFLVLVLAVLAAGVAFAQSQAVVSADTVNVRKGPGTNYAVAGQLTKGTRVQVLDSSGQWWKIKSDKVEGYVHSDYLTASGSGSSSSGSKSSSKKFVRNWISGEVDIFGGGVRYEFMLTPKMSIGGNAYWNTLIIWNEFGVDVSFRFYPGIMNNTFFFGGALGYHIHTGWYDDYDYYYDYWGAISGVAITPEVGWKFDFGDPGGFFLQPGIKFPVTFGMLEAYYWWEDDRFRVGFGVVPYICMGFCF